MPLLHLTCLWLVAASSFPITAECERYDQEARDLIEQIEHEPSYEAWREDPNCVWARQHDNDNEGCPASASDHLTIMFECEASPAKCEFFATEPGQRLSILNAHAWRHQCEQVLSITGGLLHGRLPKARFFAARKLEVSSETACRELEAKYEQAEVDAFKSPSYKQYEQQEACAASMVYEKQAHEQGCWRGRVDAVCDTLNRQANRAFGFCYETEEFCHMDTSPEMKRRSLAYIELVRANCR